MSASTNTAEKTSITILARAAASRKATANRDWAALAQQGVITQTEYRYARRFGRMP